MTVHIYWNRIFIYSLFVFPPSRKTKFKIQIKIISSFILICIRALTEWILKTLFESKCVYYVILMYAKNPSCQSIEEGKWRDWVDILKTSHSKSYANEGFKKWVPREYKKCSSISCNRDKWIFHQPDIHASLPNYSICFIKILKLHPYIHQIQYWVLRQIQFPYH